MGRIDINEVENYGGQGNGSYFSLKNDKDVATVRFMYNSFEDIQGYAVHEIEIDGKKRYVSCLRAYNEPVHNCPLCAAGNKVIVKFFVPLYDIEAQEVKIWDRGRNFKAKLDSLCTRYNPLVSTPFEIERNGKKGDTNTTYETFNLVTDDVTLDDLPEIPEVLGNLVLDKSFEDLTAFLEDGSFPTEAVETRRAERQPEAPVETRRQAPAPTRAAVPARGAAPTRAAQPAAATRRPTGPNKF